VQSNQHACSPRALFADQAMVNYMDGVVGDMVDALQAKGMWENTLWFHQSDNGMVLLGQHGPLSLAPQLR
jgi:arylsulfatase A-like enzyme